MLKKYILVSVLALALVFTFGAVKANAALTLADLAITSDGALTVTSTGLVLAGTATTGFSYGTSASPIVLAANPGALVKGMSITITHSAGAGNDDDLIAAYKKLNVSGAGDSGLTPVTDRAILNVGLTGGSNNSAIAEGYVHQDTLTHGGTGTTAALSTISSKLDVGAENFTATNTADVLHLFLRGAATVTSTDYNGAYIDIGGEVVGLNAALKINVANNAQTAYGMQVIGNPVAGLAFTGAPVTAIDFTATTIAPDASGTNSAFALGDLLGPKTVTMVGGAGAQKFDPIQVNLNIVGANPSTTSTTNVIYQNVAHTTTDMANLRIKNSDWTIDVGKNLQDAYNQQNEVDLTASSNATGQVASVSASLQIQGVAHTIGEGQALYASTGGSGTFTSSELTVGKFVLSASGGTAKGILEANSAAGATATNGILFDGEGAITNALQINMGSGAGVTNVMKFASGTAYKDGVKVTASAVTAGSASALIRIDIAGTTYYIPAFAAGDVTNE